MASVVVLSCPVCAAPLRPDASRCAYCGSLVVIQTDLPRLDPAQLNRAVVEEHIARFRARVRRDPNDAEAHYGLGLAYFNLGLLDEAADELAQAARLTPENPHIQYQLAVVYDRLTAAGRPAAAASARDRVERALLLRPDYADALVLKGNLLIQKSQLSEAVRVWGRAAGIDAEAARTRLRDFLSAHEAILTMHPRYSSAAARKLHEDRVSPKRDLLFWIGLSLFLMGLFIVYRFGPIHWTASLALVLVPPALTLLYQHKRWPTETPKLRAEWKQLDDYRAALLSPQGVSVAELLTAASIVAEQLRRQPSAAQPRSETTPPQAWETCQIVANQTAFRGLFLHAQVTTPRGSYQLTGYGEDRGWPNRRQAERHLKHLRNRLVAEGWEPLPKGRHWWNLRFRRPAR